MVPPIVAESEFSDARLVAVYDTLNSYKPNMQPEFYLTVAGDVGASSVLEVGCGTGLIAHQFIQAGYAFTGVEPSRLMLDRARQRPGSEKARWICGTTEDLDLADIDFAFMAGHVAQFFLTDEDWSDALGSIHGVLRPGGCLAFESRNPLLREWNTWPAAWRQTAMDPEAGLVSTSADIGEVTGELVSYTLHYTFHRSGLTIQAPGCLRFRNREQLQSSLEDAGFEITDVFGDWDRRPSDNAAREIIIVAVRN